MVPSLIMVKNKRASRTLPTKYLWAASIVILTLASVGIYRAWRHWKSISNSAAQQAMREHELYIHEAQGMTPEQRTQALRNQAAMLTDAFSSASETEKSDIEQRLVGIYGSLADFDSAIAVSKQLLKNPNISEKAKSIYGTNYAELILTKALVEAHSSNSQTSSGLPEEYVQAKSTYAGDLVEKNPLKSLSLLQMESRVLASSRKFREIVDMIDQLEAIYQTGNTSNPLPSQSDQYAQLSTLVGTDPSGMSQIAFWNKVKTLKDSVSLDRAAIAIGLFQTTNLKQDSIVDDLIDTVIKHPESPSNPILADSLTSFTLIPNGEFPKARKLLSSIVTKHEADIAAGGAGDNLSYIQACYSDLISVLQHMNDTPQTMAVAQRYLALFPNASDRKRVEGVLYDLTR
jgi:hypothetical protein